MINKERYRVIDNGFIVHIEDTTLTEDKHEGYINDIYQLCNLLNVYYSEREFLKECLKEYTSINLEQLLYDFTGGFYE